MQQDAEEANLLFVVRATNIVETKMKSIIANFARIPEEKRTFVDAFLLHNSIVSFAAKSKLILAIAKELGVRMDKNAIHVLLSRRNAFAHQDHLKAARVVTDQDGVPDVAFVVESIKGNGELEVITQEQAFIEFVSAYETVERDLDALAVAAAGSTP